MIKIIKEMILVGFLTFLLLIIPTLIFFPGCTSLHQPPTSEPEQLHQLAQPGIAYEGELNPNEFDKWKLESTEFDPFQGVVWGFVKNPDPESAIEKVALLYDFEGKLLGYRYFKFGTAYGFIFDGAKYVETKFTEEHQQSCRECHPDQAKKYFQSS